jgi:hypothetical protein
VNAAALAGDQHLGARRPLGVGQVAVLLDDQRAPQRDHHEHAHQTACDRQDGDARDVEVVAHQQNRGNREHDPRRYRVRSRARRLNDVVLEDRRPSQRKIVMESTAIRISALTVRPIFRAR